jgi:zonular occludens toxin Zot
VIYGKVGRLGHGKTMRMVVDGLALARLRGALEGRTWMAGNIAINAPPGLRYVQLPMDGFSEALAHLMTDALAAEVGLVVVVDEIDTVWDAHEWQNMRKSDRYRLKQSRKFGADLIWSAQFVDQVEKSIRNITEEVELLRAIPAPTIERREKQRRPWFLRGQRFRPGAVRELVGEAEKDKRLGAAWHRYRREHEALYNTDELVIPVDDESLCARHRKQEVEARCPRCIADGQSDGFHPPALVAFAVAAADSPVEATPPRVTAG